MKEDGKMSRISGILTVLGIVTPLGTQAIGIGDIRAHSALNQNLSADVPLVLSGNDAPGDIRVELASPDDFREAGITRTAAVNQLSFELQPADGGQYVIHVSSREPVSEPFLDFILKVGTGENTVRRKLTLLLDPPSQNTYVATDDDAPRQGYRIPQSSRPARPQPIIQNTSPAITEMAANAAYDKNLGAADDGTETYGPVQPGETLSEVAGSLAENLSVPTSRLALALYYRNPKAFSGSMDALRTGAILHVPGRNFIARFDRNPTPPPQIPLAGPLELPVMPVPMAPASTPRPAYAQPGPEQAALRKENEELRNRLIQLELRLGETERQLSQKTAELTSLRSGTEAPAAVPPAPETAQPAVTLPASSAGQLVKALPENAAEQSPARTTPVETTHPAAVPQQSPAPLAKALPQDAPAQATASQSRQPPSPATAGNNTPGQSAGIPSYSVFTAAGLAILGLAGIWFRHSRRRPEASPPAMNVEPPRPAPREAMIPPPAVPAPATQELAPATDIPSAVPFPQAGGAQPQHGLPLAETEVVDPLLEADVYLQYGRYAHAEALIHQAIRSKPEQNVYRLKLFEIYKRANQPEAFTSYVRELMAAATPLPPAFWQQVQQIASGWIPGGVTGQNPLTDYGQAPEPGTRLEEKTGIDPVSGQNYQQQTGIALELTAADTGLPPEPAREPPVSVSSLKPDMPEALMDLDFFTSTDPVSIHDERASSQENPSSLAYDTPPDGQQRTASSTLTVEEKLKLARALVNSKDRSQARELLLQICAEGDMNQREEAEIHLGRIGRAQLSIVPSPTRPAA